jgi:hypothetical protein
VINRITLEVLIRRLEAKLGGVDPKSPDVTKRPPDLLEFARSGSGHWADAVRKASFALASGNEQAITDSAVFCQQLERVGNKLALKYAATARQRAGGVSTASKRLAEQQTFWEEHQATFSKLTVGGRTPATARNIIGAQIKKKTGKRPDAKTLRKWLRVK